MKFMLDTNICSYIIKRKPLEVLEKFRTLDMDDCCISSVTSAELRYWVARNNRLHHKSGNLGNPSINGQIVGQFLAHLPVLDFDSHAALVYGRVRDELESRGIIVGGMDLLIGSHALSLNLILVTNNTKDFVNFPDMYLENWV